MGTALSCSTQILKNTMHTFLPKLSYALSLLTQLLPVPFIAVNSRGEILSSYISEADSWNVLRTDRALLDKICSVTLERKVTLITDERPVIYGGVKCLDDILLILGPVLTYRVDYSFSKLYALRHHAENVSLMVCSAEKLSSVLLLVHAVLTGESLALTSFMDSFFMSENMHREDEHAARVMNDRFLSSGPHNPGIFEKRIRIAIESGDIEMLQSALNSPYASMRGTIAGNPLRNAQNLAVIDITIATRAAIDAGVSVEEMYVLADAFILEVEDCKYPEDASSLARACAVRCAQRVKKMLREKLLEGDVSSAVVKAQEYIERHINEKIEIADIASSLKVSEGYLMRLFKKEQGSTLGDYIRSKKIEVAKVMLSSTENSIAEISSILSFNSQSHFGRIFLKETGQTPAKFREKQNSHSHE